MSQPQKGICAEANLHGLFLLFNVVEDDPALIRRQLARILGLFDHYDEEHYEAMVSGVVAVGSNYWLELYPGLIPIELAPFPDMHCGDRHAPAVPCDLYIQIRADRADVCFGLGMAVYELLKPYVELVEQVKGFRYLDGRDLNGFRDDNGNPRGLRKMDVAIVGDNDPDFAGGSYLHIQRYRHNMDRWEQLSEAEQEVVMGRTKADGVPLPESLLDSGSHFQRTSQAQDGQPQEILRQSMPYGDMQEQGLFFVSCAASPKPFTRMLESMIYGDDEGTYDKLLDYTSAETGAAFFAPSVSFIKRQARGS
ncbi:putative deferrochelatase/peroxidase YfeX [Saliniradius amylolyticus]|uniref:Putative deferrochelatase/peroxidase YfeX n=1 Tax=Saliniradius amylolyticus TaxID=2183582 RepID=A0A2S2E5Y4_9ALTE|nr:Dyp-type peroxidase [Saliniradius amylolyticus]AWL13061.1 putative deferrochelatase/peroxidase YfeX [Saliniradius amylolyticus]